MAQFQLIVKFPFESLDWLSAREDANRILGVTPSIDLNKAEIKLQEVFQDKPPVKVPLFDKPAEQPK